MRRLIQIQKYRPFLGAGFNRLRAFSRYPAVRIIVNLLVAGFCLVYLFTHYNNISQELKQAHIELGWFGLSIFLTLVTVWTSAIAWWLLLRGFDQPVSFPQACRIHLKSSVAKYIPGYAWQFLGKAYLTRQMGVPKKLISILIMGEFVLLIWSGLSVSFLTIQNQLLVLWKVPALGSSLFTLAGLLLLLVLYAFPFMLHFHLASILIEYRVKPLFLLLSISMIILGWLLLGLTLSTISTSFGYSLPGNYLYYVFTFSVSLLAGILAIPIPNGLGVREGIMAYLLSFFIPLPIAVVISAVARLEIVAGDLISVFIIEGIVLNKSKEKPESRIPQR